MSQSFSHWTLKSAAEKKFLRGHPWVFSNDISSPLKSVQPGQIVRLQTDRGRFLAWGYGNPHSLIAFRRLSLVEVDEQRIEDGSFWSDRLFEAFERRRKLGCAEFSFRLCFGEADGLPGLIVDRFLLLGDESLFVVQAQTAGMEKIESRWGEIFQRFAEKTGIAEYRVLLKRDSSFRTLEGLEILPSVWIKGPEIKELVQLRVKGSGLTPTLFLADFAGGQKTGFFLDQVKNVQELLSFLGGSRSLKVLDLFCYVGQWGTQIAKWGQANKASVEVHLADSSASALEVAQKNVSLQGAKAEVYKRDLMEDLGFFPGPFDVVICDPPALIKSKKHFESGKRGYEKVFTAALSQVKYGGLFVASSCSHHLSFEDMREVLKNVEAKTRRSVSWVYFGGHAPDHPIVQSFPEGFYLKCWIGVVS